VSGRAYQGVLGVFSHLDTTVQSLGRLEKLGFQPRVLSPVPRHEILDALYPKPSPVRYYSLVGAITGTVAGFALATWTGRQMHPMAMLVSGKPVDAWPTYFVIGFELTVLFGALATMTGFLLHSRLPELRRRGPYDPIFSDDRFGVFVPCEGHQWEEVKAALKAAGAEEVRVERG
jgi:hypothetical protein